MSTKTIDIHEPQIGLSELLALVSEGTEVVLTDGAKPVARLIPADNNVPSALTPTQNRVPDLFPGAIKTTPDFDDPLPDDFWLGSE